MDSNGYSDPYVKWWVSCLVSLICFIQWLLAQLLWDRSSVKDIKAKEKLCCFLGVGILHCLQSKIACLIEKMLVPKRWFLNLFTEANVLYQHQIIYFLFHPPPPPMEHSRFFKSLTPPFWSHRWDWYKVTENSRNGWMRISLPRRSSYWFVTRSCVGQEGVTNH